VSGDVRASVRIGPVALPDVRRLRSLVLRPGVAPDALAYPGDETPGAVHVGAYDGDRLVGIASLNREAYAAQPGVDAWRLRGMATLPDVRGAGHGRAMLEHAFAQVRAAGGELLWCNARVVALGFYRRLRFVTQGAEFDIPPIGPHYVMTRRLVPVADARVTLRPARDDEAVVLGALARRSQGLWGDAPGIIEAMAPRLDVAPAELRGGLRFFSVAEVDGQLAGFHSLESALPADGDDADVVLRSLYVEPAYVAGGLGARLLAQARGVCSRLGATRLVVDSDPRAAGFFARAGGVRVGTGEPAHPGGPRLPRFAFPC
jgi:GNAT superfamily N-acetyltransferase